MVAMDGTLKELSDLSVWHIASRRQPELCQQAAEVTISPPRTASQ
jgi:hypothetical protein